MLAPVISVPFSLDPRYLTWITYNAYSKFNRCHSLPLPSVIFSIEHLTITTIVLRPCQLKYGNRLISSTYPTGNHFHKNDETDRQVVKGREVEMKILCLGFSRTGTTSPREALTKLGYSPYKITEVFAHRNHVTCWVEAINAKFHGKGNQFQKEGFDKLLGKYDVHHTTSLAK
jgi:hypothetical protein